MNKIGKIGVILLTTCLLGLLATTVSAKPQWITQLTLQYSEDDITYTDMSGALTPGFVLELDPTVPFFYIDIKTVAPVPDVGDYPFYLKTAPKGPYFKYWATKGVTAESDPTTWQGEMWKIINGVEPMFYLHAQDNGYAFLIDGLLLWLYGNPYTLRVSGDYLPGTYHFIGKPVIGGEATSTMIKIFFK